MFLSIFVLLKAAHPGVVRQFYHKDNYCLQIHNTETPLFSIKTEKNMKQLLRKRMRQLNRAVSAAGRRAAGERLCRRVEALPEFAAAHCVALFAALADEPDTAPMLGRWAAGRRLVLPRVEGEVMHFYDYDPATVRSGSFGIDEPQQGIACPPADIDLIVVPGVAFTASGFRLGRGRGYYDRYLAQPGFRGCTVGVCYAHQLVDTLPVEPHDIPLQRVLAE